MRVRYINMIPLCSIAYGSLPPFGQLCENASVTKYSDLLWSLLVSVQFQDLQGIGHVNKKKCSQMPEDGCIDVSGKRGGNVLKTVPKRIANPVYRKRVFINIAKLHTLL